MGSGDWEVGLGSVFGKWYWEVGSVSEFRISLDNFLNNLKSNLDQFGVFFLYIFCSKSTQDGPSWVHGGGREADSTAFVAGRRVKLELNIGPKRSENRYRM